MWGGEDVDENTVEACDNCHYATHILIDMAVELGAWPSDTARHFSITIQRWALKAWDNRPPNPTRTLSFF